MVAEHVAHVLALAEDGLVGHRFVILAHSTIITRCLEELPLVGSLLFVAVGRRDAFVRNGAFMLLNEMLSECALLAHVVERVETILLRREVHLVVVSDMVSESHGCGLVARSCSCISFTALLDARQRLHVVVGAILRAHSYGHVYIDFGVGPSGRHF